MKLPRLLAVWFLVFGTSIFCLPFAQAVPQELMARDVLVICSNPAGETHTATIGWDADNTYFDGKGLGVGVGVGSGVGVGVTPLL